MFLAVKRSSESVILPLILLDVKRSPDGNSELLTHSVCREKSLEWKHFCTHFFSRETKLGQGTNEARTDTQDLSFLKRKLWGTFWSVFI